MADEARITIESIRAARNSGASLQIIGKMTREFAIANNISEKEVIDQVLGSLPKRSSVINSDAEHLQNADKRTAAIQDLFHDGSITPPIPAKTNEVKNDEPKAEEVNFGEPKKVLNSFSKLLVEDLMEVMDRISNSKYADEETKKLADQTLSELGAELALKISSDFNNTLKSIKDYVPLKERKKEIPVADKTHQTPSNFEAKMAFPYGSEGILTKVVAPFNKAMDIERISKEMEPVMGMACQRGTNTVIHPYFEDLNQSVFSVYGNSRENQDQLLASATISNEYFPGYANDIFGRYLVSNVPAYIETEKNIMNGNGMLNMASMTGANFQFMGNPNTVDMLEIIAADRRYEYVRNTMMPVINYYATAGAQFAGGYPCTVLPTPMTLTPNDFNCNIPRSDVPTVPFVPSEWLGKPVELKNDTMLSSYNEKREIIDLEEKLQEAKHFNRMQEGEISQLKADQIRHNDRQTEYDDMFSKKSTVTELNKIYKNAEEQRIIKEGLFNSYDYAVAGKLESESVAVVVHVPSENKNAREVMVILNREEQELIGVPYKTDNGEEFDRTMLPDIINKYIECNGTGKGETTGSPVETNCSYINTAENGNTIQLSGYDIEMVRAFDQQFNTIAESMSTESYRK